MATNLGDMVVYFSTAGPRPATIINMRSATRADISVFTKMWNEGGAGLDSTVPLTYLEDVERGATVGKWLESTDDQD